MAVSSVVEDHIEPAEMRHGLVDGFLCRLSIGDVQTLHQYALTASARQSANGINIASRGHQSITVIENGLTDRSAKSARASGHKPDALLSPLFRHRSAPFFRGPGSPDIRLAKKRGGPDLVPHAENAADFSGRLD